MIFDNYIFTEMILPFLLVFVLIFAILQKSKILGEGKAQIDALIGLVVGLIVIGFPVPRGIIVNLMPWMAVGVSVILVFLILYGFVAGDLSGEKVPKWMKITFGILAGLFVIGVVMYVTKLWALVLGGFSFGSEFWVNVAVIALIVGAMIVAVTGAKK